MQRKHLCAMATLSVLLALAGCKPDIRMEKFVLAPTPDSPSNYDQHYFIRPKTVITWQLEGQQFFVYFLREFAAPLPCQSRPR